MKWKCPKCGAVVYGGRAMTEAQIQKMHVCEKKSKEEKDDEPKKQAVDELPEFEKASKDTMFRKGHNK